MEGMSNDKMSHFLNNICSFPNTCYLEIGTWKGSTFFLPFTKIEKAWSDVLVWIVGLSLLGPILLFISFAIYLFYIPYQFYSQDCFSVPPESLIEEKINVYIYDGAHSQKDQSDAFLVFDAVLDDLFVAIVDDWDYEEARLGTFRHFVFWTIKFSMKLFTSSFL